VRSPKNFSPSIASEQKSVWKKKIRKVCPIFAPIKNVFSNKNGLHHCLHFFSGKNTFCTKKTFTSALVGAIGKITTFF